MPFLWFRSGQSSSLPSPTLDYWAVAVTDLESNARAVIRPHDLKLTTRLNSHATATFKLGVHEEFADELSVGDRVVKVYKNGQLRFHGKIAAPLTEDKDWIYVTAHDPFFFLSRRRLQTATTFTATDAGTIAWSLIDTQNARSTTRLRQGTLQASVSRDRSYIEGDIVADLIKNLAEVDSGFSFIIKPVDEVAGILGEFEVRWPLPGADSAAMFGYGNATVGNLSNYEVEYALPINRLRATGSVEGETVLSAYREDAASIAQYDLMEDERSFNSVVLTETLDQHALANLQPQPATTYRVQISDQASGDPNGVFVPSLFTDFGVGDTVLLSIRHGRLDISQRSRVAEATLAISDVGSSERLENLLLMEDTA